MRNALRKARREMKVELTDEQLKAIDELLNTRMNEIDSQIRRGPVDSVHDELKYDRKVLQALKEHLQKAQTSEATQAAWEGYSESQKVPSNPPPGSCST